MSTPRSLNLPKGVEATTIETSRGAFATHAIRVTDAVAHVLLIPGWTGSKEDFTPILPLLASVGFDATAYDQRGQFETPRHASSSRSAASISPEKMSDVAILKRQLGLSGCSAATPRNISAAFTCALSWE